jgi:type VI secretion system protein ImpA
MNTKAREVFPSSENIETRIEAMKQLNRVADFFQRMDPDSPMSYLLRRAVRWGEMPLEQWLGE